MYIRTDEQHDVLVSLREVLHQLSRLPDDLSHWKWALKAMACAVNGALVCNVNGTTQTGALDGKAAEKTLDILQNHKNVRDIPRAYLASPECLFKRAQGIDRIETAGSNITVDELIKDDFKRLLSIRNDFEHFSPKGWSLEVSGLPRIMLSNIKIIEKIYLDGWSFRHLSKEDSSEMGSLINKIKANLEN